VPLRVGDFVLHACPREAMPGFSGFLLRSRVPVPFFRQNGMAVAVSLAPHCRAAAMRPVVGLPQCVPL